MFWVVMTVVAGGLCALYAAIAVWGGALGIGKPRAAKVGHSVWGLLAWTSICVWHVVHAK